MAAVLETQSSNEQHFFEGAEKLFEVWFDSSLGQGDLRCVPREKWEELLRNVNCEIISEARDDHMIAYVLSESSMFVSKNRFILKTCGQTTLLKAVKPLMALCKEQCGMDKVRDVFYSRKKFIKPELQKHVHRDFDNEVKCLDEVFEDGAAYALGRLNGNCWYMYTMETGTVNEPDQTLELLMQDLDPAVMQIFTKERSADGKDATKKSGINEILPGSVIDDFLFEPCGYSMNGMLPDGQYFTIHVTPEPEFSYVSFETNVARESYHDLIVKILTIFKPGHFLMTLFANKDSIAKDEYRKLENLSHFEGYCRSDHQFSQFKNYNLTYTYYDRPHVTKRPAGYI